MSRRYRGLCTPLRENKWHPSHPQLATTFQFLLQPKVLTIHLWICWNELSAAIIPADFPYRISHIQYASSKPSRHLSTAVGKSGKSGKSENRTAKMAQVLECCSSHVAINIEGPRTPASYAPYAHTQYLGWWGIKFNSSIPTKSIKMFMFLIKRRNRIYKLEFLINSICFIPKKLYLQVS